MRLRMLLPDIADPHPNPYSHPNPHSYPDAYANPHSMPMHEPGPVYLLRRAVRKLQLPALRVLLQPARNPNPHSYPDAYANPHSYAYLHPTVYPHSDARPVACPRSPA
jgi:hypothetical protein